MHSEFMNTLRPIPALSALGARVPSLRDGCIDEAKLQRATSLALVVARR